MFGGRIMIITQIVQNKRFKNYYDIYIDEEYQFFITYTELKFLKLQENNNITKESLELIYREYVYKRAKNRAFRLLQRKDMTRKEMISKLEISRYNEYIIDSVINFLEEYRYINDREYAIKYISYNKTRKSIKQISIELVRKGIDKEVIKELLEDTEICEEDIAYSLLIKKYRNIDSIDNKIKNRMLGYIMRKGYSYNIAIKTINRLKDEKDL
jgi:regulatory protein